MSKTLCEFALDYAARGWAVFPCSTLDKSPFVGCDKDDAGKKIRGTGGVKKASRDVNQIKAWWQQWPQAMIGVACGAWANP